MKNVEEPENDDIGDDEGDFMPPNQEDPDIPCQRCQKSYHQEGEAEGPCRTTGVYLKFYSPIISITMHVITNVYAVQSKCLHHYVKCS
jgi:hypothetical protein